VSAQMATVVRVGRRALYYADRRFEKPGLYIWAFQRNLRILPLPKRYAREFND